MATFALIHGAGDVGWYWHLVEAELRERGHDTVAPDLPCDDDSAGLPEYVDAVVEAIGDRTDLVLVAQSMAGFTAPLVCQRVPVDLMVLLAAMVPAPGESPGDWWDNTGWEQARREQNQRDGRDPDAEVDVVADAMARGERSQSGTPFEKPWPLAAWPDVPTRVLICRDDRFFPSDFMRRVARERLGITPDEMDGGHVPALSRPRDLADRLVAYR